MSRSDTLECGCRDEQSQKRPLLGDRFPIDTLRPEYRDGSPTFVAKVGHLCDTFTHLRRTRQDGNCFYRCFIFGLLEVLLEQQDAATAAAVIKAVKCLEDSLSAAGITKLVYEDALEVLLELLQSVSSQEV
jgi:ubiquitin thioesterase protein OTUB1